jgi:Pro-kumamolisin, activation domain/IPT/TIG domain
VRRHAGLPVAILTVLAGLGGTFAAAPASHAAGRTPRVTLSASAAPQLPRGATRLGALPGTSALTVDVTLRVRNQAALNAYLAGLSDQGSPLFRHYLAPGQFGPMFGATGAQVAAVDSALRAAGLSPGPVSANGLSIPVTAAAAALDQALGTSLIRYQLTGGRVAYANTSAPSVPAPVASLVSGVVGLNTLYQAQSMVARPSRAADGPRPQVTVTPDTTGPQACAAAKSTVTAYGGGFTASQLAAHYGIAPLYGLGDEGQGTRIALVEFEPDLASDILRYKTCFGISTTVNYLSVDGGAGTGAGSGEAALDIEDIAGLAPRAALDVYRAPDSGTGNYDDYAKIVTADTDQVISTSWGVCEDELATAVATDFETLFEEAAAQGQTVLAAAGDSGSTECLPFGGNAGKLVDPLTPASFPYVVGVGGTLIKSATSEPVWNESASSEGAAGGGISTLSCMPAYQYQTAIPGLVNANSRKSATCAADPGGYLREVPDISADADPYTGYVVNWDGDWQTIGGTSAAAPLMAAVAALTDASPFCADYGSGAAGLQPAGLYAAVAQKHAYIFPSATQHEVLSDVTSGNNDYTPSDYKGGLYAAGAGYDEASGLGVPQVSGLTSSLAPSSYYPGLTALMCRYYATKLTSTAVTSISPARGPAKGGTTVTVHGSGFLPIAGADMALVGPAKVAASCTSSTTCTVTVPARAAGAAAIRVSAEDGPASPAVSAGSYTYVAAPSVTSLSPAKGTVKGGTKVTVHGANLAGASAVHFGTATATAVTVVSASEVTVTAPAGKKGTAEVTVTTAGGTSSATAGGGKYAYS